MYRKDAVRKIVREVEKRLPELRRENSWANWRLAMTATRAAHPDWFKHVEAGDWLETELREAGVDMTEGFNPGGFVGNQSSET